MDSDAILDDTELPEGAERQACIVLAGIALRKAGGDPEAAKESLTEVLHAVGAVAYETETPRTALGYLGKSKTGAGE